ncbi:DUF1569 domain-containing protein [Blastopirellula marina]|uniref:DUF1569 domain-containing protein n=1 Tax=Blastopirellula marina TaxID=124 RepID=A0A2S8GGP0_9BACT|nr:DUF1569 domain-containing protein [Blastopirellula marina]PQO40075.1 hypothetical protein C5Y98_07105 [Blastopirellula marina]PQO43635.1 hypothetical protein C5Y93_23635 [Blastopirellula marina]PTL45450.1 DUF1569 domain-containing protein [Blastopirellula marina]
MSRFQDLDDLRTRLAEVVATPHETCGRWTAAQIFYHLAGAFEGSVDGLPPGYNLLARMVLRPFRILVTRVRFPAWIPIPRAIAAKLDPPPDVTLEQQYPRLLSAIERFEQHAGPHPPHPILGAFSHAQWTGFHLRHSEHHLRFVRLRPPRA